MGRIPVAVGVAIAIGTLAVTSAQEQGRGGRGAAPPGPPPGLLGRLPAVDEAAHDRGRAIWASECINCHGTQARGSETGPNIIRTKTVNYDRFAEKPGSVLGPFLKAGHTTQSGKPSAAFTDEDVVALANFLRQRVNDTMRQSPLFTVSDILVGDPQAGEAFFKGEGGCAACHTATSRSLAGIGARMQPVDIQQRMLFPFGGGRGRGRGAAAAPNPNAITVTVTPGSGAPLSGVLVEESDFYVTLREKDGTLRVVRRAPGMTVVKDNPLQAHVDLLERITDKQIHNVVAYLARMK
jgi:cytochrome c oxidase cbb3-type subunit 3